MSAISISSPILKSFVHNDVTLTTAISTALTANATSSRRIVVLVQNKSATATIQVIFADTGTVGVIVPPLSNISLDNYNGIIRAFTDDAVSSVVHIAYSVI
jgi:uncharacterized protein (DUF111 family)